MGEVLSEDGSIRQDYGTEGTAYPQVVDSQ